VESVTAASRYTDDTICRKRGCRFKTGSFYLSASPLSKKDRLTDGKIFFDSFIKRPNKINKSKFKIRKKNSKCPLLYERDPK
jgi:hypothetical protein